METPLTLLYTGGLRGDLELLPRLYSFLRQLKAYYSEPVVQVCEREPAEPPGRTLLLDLGDTCVSDVWHCAASGGRSTLVVLDGMGYEAANVINTLAPGAREKMGANVRLALVDAEHPHAVEDVLITSDDGRGEFENRPYTLQIVLSPVEATRQDGDRLHLRRVEAGQVGVARLTQIIGRWTLSEHDVHDLPRRALPDPTIAAAAEFVLSEARQAQRRNAQ